MQRDREEERRLLQLEVIEVDAVRELTILAAVEWADVRHHARPVVARHPRQLQTVLGGLVSLSQGAGVISSVATDLTEGPKKAIDII